jgi:hypothetical protein
MRDATVAQAAENTALFPTLPQRRFILQYQ